MPMEKSIKINVDDATWEILDEVHKETTINKSTQIERLIEAIGLNKITLLSACQKELDAIATVYLSEAERLLGLRDEVVHGINKTKSVLGLSNAEVQKPVTKKAKKKQRKPSNIKKFTQNWVDNFVKAMNGSHPSYVRDVWWFDSKTKGFAIRTKKHGLVYYTRAKNELISPYTLRVKIGDVQLMSLADAKKKHKENLDLILNKNINPNTLNPKAKWQRDKNQATNVNVDYSIYNGLRWDNAMALPLLCAIANSNPAVKSGAICNYKNGFYKARGSQIHDAFVNDNKSIYELIRQFPSLKDGKKLTSLGMICAVIKSIYWHGTKDQSKAIEKGNKKNV